MERVIDVAAAEMGIDRVELRRRNQIRPTRDAVQGRLRPELRQRRFPGVLKQALELADWDGFAKRKRESKKRGKLRGIGVGCFLEVTAPAAARKSAAFISSRTARVTMLTGTLDYGQGHAAPYAQVLSDKLGIPFDRIRAGRRRQRPLAVGGGTGGSRSVMRTARRSSRPPPRSIEQGKQIAAHVLEASAADIEFADGPVRHRRHRPLDRHHGAWRGGCAAA